MTPASALSSYSIRYDRRGIPHVHWAYADPRDERLVGGDERMRDAVVRSALAHGDRVLCRRHRRSAARAGVQMTCDTVRLADGSVAIVCHRRGRLRRERCGEPDCSRDALFQCDYPTGKRRTCSRFLCADHATTRDAEDFCPAHAKARAAGRQGELFA
jgi:hypothetical protein